jgi:hypothetical protein
MVMTIILGESCWILGRIKPDFFMDSKRMVLNTDQGPRAAVVLGPKLLAAKMYERSSAEVINQIWNFPI